MGRPRTHSWRGARGARHALSFLLAAGALLAAFVLATATAAAVGGPLISEGAAWEVESEVLVGAHINPEGLKTTYKIQVECPDHAQCQATEGQLLLVVDEAQAVHLVISDPQRGGTYIFTVTAHNIDGSATASWRFQVPSPLTQEIPPGAAPNGVLDTEPYTPPPSTWANQSGKEGAERTVAEQRAKEHEEQQAKEAAARRAAEAEALRHALEAARAAAAARQREEAAAAAQREAPACVVPSLRGDTLAAARSALSKAHCRLGPVHRPADRHGALYVRAQSTPAGERLAHGARVTLWLGAKRAPRRGGMR